MFYVNSRVAMSSFSVQGYACFKKQVLILSFNKELSELGPGYRISWTCSTHMELLHVNEHLAGEPQRQELQENALCNSEFDIKKSVCPLKTEKIGSPETSVTTTSLHSVIYRKSETLIKLRFTNIIPNGKHVC